MHDLLDRIETKQKVRYGVVDYANKKQVFFYDFTHNLDPNIRLLLTLWRTNDDPYLDRFSIFAKINFPHLILPEVSIVTKNAIIGNDSLGEMESKAGITFKRV